MTDKCSLHADSFLLDNMICIQITYLYWLSFEVIDVCILYHFVWHTTFIQYWFMKSILHSFCNIPREFKGDIPSPLNYCISDPQMNLKMLFWLLLIFKVKHTNKTDTSVDVPYNNSSIFEPHSHEWTTFTDFTHGYLLWIWPHNVSLVFKI